MTARNPFVWLGLGGVAEDDNASAHAWQRRLHWVMVGMALLSVPAYLLDTMAQSPLWYQVAAVLDIAIFAAFLSELVLMLSVTRYPFRYVFENWLNVAIIAGSAAALFGAATEWIALVRMMRVALGGLVLVRVFTEMQELLTRRGAPLLLGASFLTLMATGALFYWLDPKIMSFWDGLWLAFITGATVGYGDVVPTTGPTRVVAVFMVLAGMALMTLFTANVVSFFMGAADAQARKEQERDLHAVMSEIAKLRSEIAGLREDLERSRWSDSE
jgi:voltage-gated potassium channel